MYSTSKNVGNKMFWLQTINESVGTKWMYKSEKFTWSHIFNLHWDMLLSALNL